MKGKHPRITLLGNNAGRNLGDMAIMSSILQSLSRRLPGARFYIPSTNPSWTRRHYGSRFNVRPLNVMPWTGSLRLLGLPTLYGFAVSDVAMICDGIIFGNRLFNPGFNYLITLVLLVPLARLMRCKVVCFSCGLGPFPSAISRRLARWTIDRCDLVMLRDRDSEKLAREIGVRAPIELTGDAAFINPVSGDARAVEILRELGIDPQARLLALNVTAYMDQWLAAGEKLTPKADFVSMVADGVRRAQAAVAEPFTPLVVCTQPMDEETCSRLAAATGAKVLSNSRYLSHDIQAVLRRCQLLLGMRFHSIVLASSVETPVMALIYAPKVRGYMRLLECEEFGLEMARITPAMLGARLAEAWRCRDALKAHQLRIVREQKVGAHRAVDRLIDRYFRRSAAEAKVKTRAGDTPGWVDEELRDWAER